MPTALLALSLLIASADALSPPAVDDPPPGERYRWHEQDVAWDGTLVDQALPEQLLTQLRGLGRFAATLPGETLALAALRLDQDPRVLGLINGLEEADSLPPVVAVSVQHRVLPGEDLAFLSELYSIGLPELRSINAFAPDDEAPLWSLVQVPFVIRSTEAGLRLRGALPHWARLLPEGKLTLRLRQREHLVESGDTWPSLATRYGISVRRLQALNYRVPVRGSSDRDRVMFELDAGAKVHVGMSLQVDGDALPPLLRVLVLEKVLGLRLEEALAANDCPDVAALLALPWIQLPYTADAGYPCLRMDRGMVATRQCLRGAVVGLDPVERLGRTREVWLVLQSF